MTAVATDIWTGVTSLDDPRLGIDDPRLADLGWAVFSRLLGKMSGWRSSTDRYSRFIAGTALVPLTGKNAQPALCLDLRPLGYPDGKQLLRRRGLEPNDLDSNWKRSIKLEGEEHLGRLDLELVTALFQPEIVRAFTLMVQEGAELTGRRFERWMRLVAAGEAPCGSPLGESSLETMQTAFRTVFGHLQWLLASDPDFAEFAERWRELPPLLDIDDLDPVKTTRETFATPRKDARRAFYTLRQTLAKRQGKWVWDSHLNELKLRRNCALLGTLTVVGARVETIAGMTVSPQKREDGTYRTGGYIREYVCPWDDVVRPALLFANLKGQRDKFVVKVIPYDLAQLYDEYLDYVGLSDQPAHPMWVSEWEYIDTKTGKRIKRIEYQYVYRDPRYIARPRSGSLASEDSIRYIMKTVLGEFTDRHNPHAARKLAFQLAPDAAQLHRAEGGKPLGGLLDGFTPASILCDHRLKELVGIYADITDVNSLRRQEVSWIVACRNWELLYGEKGATFGLDVEAVRAARDLLAETELELETCSERAEDLTAEIKQLHAETHPAQRRFLELRQHLRDMRAAALEHEAESITESEFRRIVLLDQERDDEQNESLRLERTLVEARDSVRSEVTRITGVAADARAALSEAVARRIPLPEPVEEEPNIELQLDELLGRTTSEDSTPQPEEVLVRDLLTLPEYADCMQMKFETLRAQVWQTRKAGEALRFPEGDKHNKWFQPLDEILVSHGNWRFVKWSALDQSKYTPAQLAAFQKTLSEPITNFRWMAAEAAILEGVAPG